jgi:hypothetical protein
MGLHAGNRGPPPGRLWGMRVDLLQSHQSHLSIHGDQTTSQNTPTLQYHPISNTVQRTARRGASAREPTLVTQQGTSSASRRALCTLLQSHSVESFRETACGYLQRANCRGSAAQAIHLGRLQASADVTAPAGLC